MVKQIGLWCCPAERSRGVAIILATHDERLVKECEAVVDLNK
ncbi:hypothetical protein [Massilicoli timonensis]